MHILTDQYTPRTQEAEEAVLGAVMVNPDAFLTVTAFLNHEDFFYARHSQVWQALQRLHDRREPVDYLTIVQELKDLGWLESAGGPAFITELLTAAPSSAHAEFYGRIVEKASVRRKLLIAADEIRNLAYDETVSIETLTSEAENKLFSVTDAQVSRDFIPMNAAIDEYFDRIDQLMNRQDGEGLGIPTTFRDLDTLLGGLQRSDLLIFAGRPGMGKTSWLLSAAVNVARQGKHVGIFTMEMGHEQLIQRIIAMETGISSQTLRRGNLSNREYARFVEAAGRVSNFPIFIDDTPALSPTQMRTKCRRLYHEHGIDLIILDYMQLMNAGGMYQNNRVQEMSYISRYLKELARELNVPLLSAAQLSRAVEQRQDKRPVLSDLRESGSIEQDADIVMFLYRDIVYNEATEHPNQAEIIVAKHRNGPTGTIQLYFDNKITKFMDGVVRNVDLGDDG